MTGRDDDGVMKQDTGRLLQELRDREARLSAFFQGAPIPTFVIDEHHRVRRWNRALETLSGISAREVLGTNEHWRAFYPKARPCLADLLIEGDRKMFSRWYEGKNIRPGLIDESLEATDFFPNLGKSGKWLRFTASAIRNPMGTMIGAVETLEDITGRVLAEAALRDNEARYRFLIDNSNDIIWTFDIKSMTYTYCSKSVERLLGYTQQEAVGKGLADVFSPQILADVTAAFTGVVSGTALPERILMEAPHIAKDGRTVWMEINAVLQKDDDGKPLSFMGVTRDVTERRKAAEELRRSEEKFRFLAEKMGDIVWTLDLNLKTTYISPSVIRVLGFTPEERMTQNETQIMTPESLGRVMELYNREMAREKQGGVDPDRVISIEVEYYHKNGSTVWLDNTIRGVRDESGKLNGIYGVSKDITDRKRADGEREKLQAQLIQSQKMESVGRLAGGVAHDFNNMLTVILGHAELALDQAGPDHPLYEDLQEINQAAGRSADLTRQLLAFARKQTIRPMVLDLNETVEGMLKMLLRLIGENIDLVWEPETALWPVKMDPSQIDQILANLCINAKDAMADGGRLMIETANQTLDGAFCEIHPEVPAGDYVLLSVSDTGIGMSGEVLANLFEPFFTTKAVGRGTGLGLATIYGIVKQNNGFINVHSEPGLGTAFKIYLPRHAVPQTRETVPESEPIAMKGNETILLVEDEPAILRMTRSMLEGLGYRVLAAENPAAAVRMARDHGSELDLLITDVVMPGMNGRELSEAISVLYPRLKVLFISGYTADAIAHFGVLNDGLHFIQKPFSVKDLQVSVRTALKGEKDLK